MWYNGPVRKKPCCGWHNGDIEGYTYFSPHKVEKAGGPELGECRATGQWGRYARQLLPEATENRIGQAMC